MAPSKDAAVTASRPVFEARGLFKVYQMGDVQVQALRGIRDVTLVAETAENLMSQVGLRQRMEHCPAQMSGGQRQRMAIARAVATRPQALLTRSERNEHKKPAGELRR